MKDCTNGELDKVLQFAESIKDNSLKNCLERLDWPHHNIEAEVFMDFAPKSFYFVRKRKDGSMAGNGGIIYHGQHDNGGDGSGPTFSVNLTPQTGWRIHT